MKSASRTHVCPIEKVVSLVGDSCSILILRDLIAGPRRFSQLEDSIGMSTRTLAIKLKHLEKEKLIERKEFHEKPPRVEYKLSRKGRAFHKVLDTMRAYGKRYLV